ncbi:hypothetical protein BC937DRAFT_93239 [Endogone sp. FLAS-F59071]|nr:hypothetical protein BC937DRAFT_93239 [Endogone sp. FLAS-F59071]|eukprot:RUS14848.1 hypothetical protein BC937DRAFT_93239 [Endogone sp. FLAS-F59071]
MSPSTAELSLPPEPQPQPSTSTSSIAPAGQGYQANGVEKEEIWSTILQNVASSKMVPSKNVLILVSCSTRASTLPALTSTVATDIDTAIALPCLVLTATDARANDPGPYVAVMENGDAAGNLASLHQVTVQSSPITKNNAMAQDELDDEKANELALSFSFLDVQDEENEDTIARLGLYQLSLAHPAYQSLLKFALNSSTLPDTLVVILLDWSRPWTFVETLERWVSLLERQINEVCREGGVSGSSNAWTKGKAVVDELKERMEHYIQTYTEPPLPQTGISANATGFSGFSGPIAPSISTGLGQAPLGPSTSTGFPLSPSTSTEFGMAPSTSMGYGSTSGSIPSTPIAATHSSTTEQVTLPLGPGTLTKNLGLPLLVVCYGASLFYTSTHHPHTFHYLREYMLHRLLSTQTKVYHFPSRAQVVERDTVLVPAGWDSWGKIRVLREGFDCEGVSEGWDMDLKELQSGEKAEDHVIGDLQSVRKVYEEVVPDPHANDQPLNVQPQITAEDEQAFFERHYEMLQRTAEGPTRAGTAGTSAASAIGSNTVPSIVGPMGIPTTTINLAAIGERDIDTEDISNKLSRLRGKEPGLSKNASNIDRDRDRDRDRERPLFAAAAATRADSTSLNGAAAIAAASSPVPGPPGAPGAPNSQNEVLANFFQSLLTKKNSGGSMAGTPTSPTTSAPQPVASSATLPPHNHLGGAGENPSNRREVRKELDKLRSSTGSKG